MPYVSPITKNCLSLTCHNNDIPIGSPTSRCGDAETRRTEQRRFLDTVATRWAGTNQGETTGTYSRRANVSKSICSFDLAVLTGRFMPATLSATLQLVSLLLLLPSRFLLALGHNFFRFYTSLAHLRKWHTARLASTYFLQCSKTLWRVSKSICKVFSNCFHNCLSTPKALK